MRVPFGDGERSLYNVAWSGMSAGTATVSIRASRGPLGIDAWTARAEAAPSAMISSLYALQYAAESTIDASTLLPRRSVIDSTEGNKRRVRTTVFDQIGHKAEYSVTIGDTVSRTIDIAPESQDILSILYLVRTLPLAPGFRKSVKVFDNGKRSNFDITVGERIVLKTAIGDLPAWTIAPRVTGEDGVAEPGQNVLWISADDRRLLLRADFVLTVGKVTLDLASFAPGTP